MKKVLLRCARNWGTSDEWLMDRKAALVMRKELLKPPLRTLLIRPALGDNVERILHFADDLRELTQNLMEKRAPSNLEEGSWTCPPVSRDAWRLAPARQSVEKASGQMRWGKSRGSEHTGAIESKPRSEIHDYIRVAPI